LGVRTHKGFTDLFETLADMNGKSLLGALAGLSPIVTGHSLGAALAALLGAALGPSCPLCVTYEGPRVGNEDFCRWSDARLQAFYRYVIVGDVVPHAPPENLGYMHAGIEIDLDPAGVIPLTLDPETYLASHHVLTSVQAILEAKT
jgi:predicted lipase